MLQEDTELTVTKKINITSIVRKAKRVHLR